MLILKPLTIDWSVADAYLLDLFITDLPGCESEVLPAIADHRAVLTKLPLPKIVTKRISRQGWIFQLAKWKELMEALSKWNWQKLDEGTAEDAVNYFYDILRMHMKKYIPFRAFQEKKMSHPWINEKCEAAIARKNVCVDQASDDFKIAQIECARILGEEHEKYIEELRIKISGLKKGSKQWWKLNRELLDKRAKTTSMPPLKANGVWTTDSKEKANLIANTLKTKAKLPEEKIDCPFFGEVLQDGTDFVCMRTRNTLKLLLKLDESKATGHDQIPAKFLKKVAHCIAAPLTKICRRMFHEGCWPECWKLHTICPLYKKKSAFDPGNYRGVHLTPILSKIAEHVIGKYLIDYLRKNSFGPNQWAFTPGRSARDLVTCLIMKWILAFSKGLKVERIWEISRERSIEFAKNFLWPNFRQQESVKSF